MRNDSGNKVYSSGYEDDSIRGREDKRPWDITAEIRQYCGRHKRLLDIGCGTCVKVLPLASLLNEIVGLDPSKDMRDKAAENGRDQSINNLTLVDGKADALPFSDNEFDIVTCIVAAHKTNEVFRVLKPGGVAIIEKLSEQDKYEFKEYFGDDENGPRGQFMHMRPGERCSTYKSEFETRYSDVSLRIGRWEAFLTREGLIKLCTETSIIRNFDPSVDMDTVDRYVDQYSGPNGVSIQHERILIVAQK